MNTGSSDVVFQRYQSAVQAAVTRVAQAFRREPASFLYESDLQALLFTRLSEELADSAISWRPSEDCWRSVVGDEPLTINPVKTEYPSRTRFDVAILDPQFFPKKKVWGQPVRVAIEVKFRQADGTGGSFKPDRAKLERHLAAARAAGRSLAGACLVFCHRDDDEELKAWREHGDLDVNPDRFELRDGGVVAWAVTPPPASTGGPHRVSPGARP